MKQPVLFSPLLVRIFYNVGSTGLFAFLLWFFLYGKPAPDYNEILSVLIGAQVTVVTVMFSAILVALQLASAQFSPRITRSFFRYNAVGQTAFYLFLFGIALCLGVKFTYSKETGQFAYPLLPTAAVVFTFFLMSVVLPQFVFHIADSMNVAAIIRRISQRTVREMDLIYGPPVAEGAATAPERAMRRPERPCIGVQARGAGFLGELLTERLKIIVRSMPEWHFYVQPLVGNFISPGEVLVLAEPPANAPSSVSLPDGFVRVVRSCFDIGDFRSYEQDVLFGVRQLVDIAIKAISPAVNDPTTAINCLNHLGVITAHQAQAPLQSKAMQAMPPNLHLKDFSFAMLVNLAFDQIFQWGRQDPVVTRHLLSVLCDVVLLTRHPDHIEVLKKQVQDMEIDQLHYALEEQNEQVRERWRAVKKLLNLE